MKSIAPCFVVLPNRRSQWKFPQMTAINSFRINTLAFRIRYIDIPIIALRSRWAFFFLLDSTSPYAREA